MFSVPQVPTVCLACSVFLLHCCSQTLRQGAHQDSLPEYISKPHPMAPSGPIVRGTRLEAQQPSRCQRELKGGPRSTPRPGAQPGGWGPGTGRPVWPPVQALWGKLRGHLHLALPGQLQAPKPSSCLPQIISPAVLPTHRLLRPKPWSHPGLLFTLTSKLSANPVGSRHFQTSTLLTVSS